MNVVEIKALFSRMTIKSRLFNFFSAKPGYDLWAHQATCALQAQTIPARTGALCVFQIWLYHIWNLKAKSQILSEATIFSPNE